SIVCVAGHHVKPCSLDLADDPADNTTRVHRFLESSAIRVRHFLDNEKKLHANGVIIRPARRREKIARELEAFVKRGNYRMHEDRDLERLVAYLNEYPTVIQGDFEIGRAHV